MKTEEIVVLLIPVLFVVMWLIERRKPARHFPEVARWQQIGWLAFVVAGLFNATLPTVLPEHWAAEHRLFTVSDLGLWPSVIVAHLAITLITFAWHRLTHHVHWLWRGFHQLHHAPQHLNIYAANVLHPSDLAMYILLPWLMAVFVLGIDPLAAAIVGNIGALNAYFQHWNVNTPRWLGYFLQRPEAHCIHHQRHVHAYNYSDFPLWDMLFGSYKNPTHWQGETGFDSPAASDYGAMLRFVDVNARSDDQQTFAQTNSKDGKHYLPSI